MAQLSDDGESGVMFLGIDIGTGSSKACLVDEAGQVRQRASRPHQTSRPQPGWFEHDAEQIWWQDVVALCRELPLDEVQGLAISGIGPAILPTDAADRPLRPAILYGIDSRAAREVAEQNEDLGVEELLKRAGNVLSSQAVGPKLAWMARHEPEIWAQARRLYSAPGWIVQKLTGQYTMDRYSASASDPLYDMSARDYWPDQWEALGDIERPRLVECSEIAGHVTEVAADETGLPVGIPVVGGMIDALAEAYSVGCEAPGDTMVMYGSTMFLIQVVESAIPSTVLWATEGRTMATYSLAAGMATGGLVTSWLRDTLGRDYADLERAAARVPAGSDGLMLLPYFAGERTPIFDPQARGIWSGLTMDHGPGHLYRSALEGISLGVRHNIEAMTQLGAPPGRLVAVGGGTAQRLWLQILSDVTGLSQDLPTVTDGASYGDARTVAEALGIDTSGWNSVAERLEPHSVHAEVYDREFELYLRSYRQNVDIIHDSVAVADGGVDQRL